jgi:hypothetical protein
MIIDLSNEERDLLISLLMSSIGNTREEIYHTEQYDFKAGLKNEKRILESMLWRLVGSETRIETNSTMR